MKEARKLAVQLANGPTVALGAAGSGSLYEGWDDTSETQMEKETQTIAKLAASPAGAGRYQRFCRKAAALFSRMKFGLHTACEVKAATIVLFKL